MLLKNPRILFGGVLCTFWEVAGVASRLEYLYRRCSEVWHMIPINPDWLFPSLGLLMIVYALLVPNFARSRVRVLKREAREIRRRQVDSEFTKAPINRGRWSPPTGQPCTVEQKEAREWHDQYQKLGIALSPSLDFDGVMEALDKVESEGLLSKLPWIGKHLQD